MRILIYGSSYLTELCEGSLMDEGHTIVGHVPCKAPAFPGQMKSPLVFTPPPGYGPFWDIALSILYDRKITWLKDTYNIHPGLLPRWGGCDILYHTITEGAHEQGMTFHMLDEGFDTGRVLRSQSWWVRPGSKIVDLYQRLCHRMPTFAVQCVSGIEPELPAHYYKRGEIDQPDLYRQGGDDIRDFIRRRREVQSRQL